MLCFTQDADTNKKFPDQFSPTTYGCFAFSISLFSKQNSLSQQQPPLGQTWYISSLVRYVSLAVVVRQECSTQNMPHIGHTNSFSQLYSSSKIKRQKDAISLNVLSCAHAQVSHVTRSGGFESCAKFHNQLWTRMLFLQTISIITKCYPSLFARTLFHIILTFPCLLLKNKTTYKIYMCFHATVLSAFRM